MSTPPTHTTDVELLERDADEGTAVLSYDLADRPTVAVVDAVATVEGVDPISLEPLHDAVDTDALDRLVGHTRSNGDVRVTFAFAGYEVEIEIGSAGRIRLEPRDR
ncbi:HalOD1 output domain-containing protein [Natrialbaceae archaeon AArc-T1-2]|uniref:HalOD1 output domain-containing protein n=1 Tax=Natrialbaceae archaeon AArc-T1-2 TaxID=3053904 RepID=UPI00255A850C|nr:HalOD1 output domain-containing protein [Natrialbaceae archaeon AArc-T1-2]WIV67868.1 hypothetical protein QQ977_03810 [Natrialbaceae archaeon AArc-T1-2]